MKKRYLWEYNSWRMSFNRINILFIIGDHLRNVRESLWLFILVPLAVSAGLCSAGVFVNSSVVSIIITSLSIFIALFFNVNVLLLDLKKKAGGNQDRVSAYQETQVSISFLVITGLFAILTSYGSLCDNRYLKVGFNCLTYFLLGVFFLTVTMAIKNVHVLFEDDLTRTK